MRIVAGILASGCIVTARKFLTAAALATLGLAGCAQPNTQSAGQPPLPEDYAAAATNLPKMVFFDSEPRNEWCFGNVTKIRAGVPAEVQVLRSQGEDLCYPRHSLPESRAGIMKDVRSALDAQKHVSTEPIEREVIERTQVLAPVPFNAAWLKDDTDEGYEEENEIFIVGALINYKAHADETVPADKRLFPKPTAPTGAYAPVSRGERRVEGQSGSVCLLDHEVEIAYLALEDIALDPPPAAGELWRKLAFFAVNDVSDREPIILDPERGFTRGKARPGYLPSGPWLIAGEYLRPKTNEGGEDLLPLKLWTREASATDDNWIQRQAATSDQMILGLRGILEELAKRAPDGAACKSNQVVCSMQDVDGKEREMIRGNKLPAGSIVLTGTPGGTAIQAPGQFKKFMYGLRGLKYGGFNEENGRKVFLSDQLSDRAELGYLEPGDWVNQVVGQLGRQEWQVDSSPDTSAAECSLRL
jgi:2-keto-4-pentenoate hydratase/2-oxohepta-3-ene-1,7-dioic acid hydratase in catechol pathway